MKKRNRILRVLLLVLAVSLLLGVAVFADGDGEEAVPSMYGTFWALVPPLVAIVLALITKEAYSALFVGVVIGALFAADFAPVRTVDLIINDGLITALADNAGIFLFLVLLGILVALVNAAGGSAAFGRWAEKNIRTKAGAMIATFVLGVLIFIDDYFNCLTVGSVMRPVTDSHKISRQKLAYLIDATAAPVCMIAPVSSWAAAVSGTAEGLDTGITGIQLFIKAIPYNFYSLLTFVFIIALVVMKFDYGPMIAYEKRAKAGEETGLKETGKTEGNPKGRVLDLILPVVVLIVFCTIGMLYVGGFFGTDWWGDTGFQGDFIGAFGNTDSYVGLPWGALISLVLVIIYLLCRRVVTFKQAMECIPKGFNAMVAPILILTLAISLKTMTNSYLGLSVFVHDLMEGAASGLYKLLPAIIFAVAVALAFASGTSWGTFGILIPIVTAIFPAESPLMIIGISACCAGAVCGDHCSPISDTTIMASAGAQVEHVTHVSTQLPYAMTVAAVSFVCFLLAGFIQSWPVCLLIGAVITVLVLFVLKKSSASKQPA
ncbi:MAG: Na+/H+ antiporter NhaC family protein [Oscillospiraceae bacterium]|nr:Na+/H+ antiporter NhaC family protein [Oscillospiraceae bacterium]